MSRNRKSRFSTASSARLIEHWICILNRTTRTIIVQVDAPPGQAIGIKEAVAMHLEPLGGVQVISVMEDAPEQLHVEGYKGPQDAPRRKEA